MRAVEKMSRSLAICTAAFNEEKILPRFAEEIRKVLVPLLNDGLIDDYEIWIVDDGSTDRTWDIIEHLHKADSHIRGLKLSGNYGHHLAGFKLSEYLDTEYVIMMDCDLNFPPPVIEDVIRKLEDNSIVWITATERSGIEKAMSNIIARIISLRFKATLPANVLGFGFKREVTEYLRQCPNRAFLNMCIANSGMKSEKVVTSRLPSPRPSRYNLGKRVKLALKILAVLVTDKPISTSVEVEEVLK